MTHWLFDLGLHLKFVGVTLILLGLSHAFFDARFEWKTETARLSLLNRQIFYVHTFFVALVVTMMGVLCLFGTRGLLEPTFLGRWLCLGLALFWAARLFCQFFVYSPQLWRGKRFETCIHLLFACGWSYYTLVFAWAWWAQAA